MHPYLYISCFVLLLSGLAQAATPPAAQQPELETEHFRIRLLPRTPNQIAAFYEARGFPDTALAELRKTCFITLGIRNKSKTIVWFDLANWSFQTPTNKLQRILREDWKERWSHLGLEQRLQATFRWTLMPEHLDFRPNEAEGGNLTLPRTDQPLTIVGEVYVGKQKNDLYQVKFENVFCATD